MGSKNKDEYLIDDMNDMYITCTEVDACANCGKEGSDLNICNKCMMVKYCNAVCKKKHRTKHKKKCEKRVAELRDIELFKQPPQNKDCPICFMLLPLMDTGRRYNSCCGKSVCSGCVHAVTISVKGVPPLCPFCRTQVPSLEKEALNRIKKRVEAGDANALFGLGSYHFKGLYGLPQDINRASELFLRAGELGCAEAYFNIGNSYRIGRVLERDDAKANHYYALAAMEGGVNARHNLGVYEDDAGNWDRALKHYMISAGSGYDGSVENIKLMFMDGHATKEDYANALQSYQKYLDEIKGEQRDAAAAFDDRYKYY